MAEFNYPANTELTLIAQERVADLTLTDPIFQFFPIETQNTSLVMWEQMDNYVGLQQIRGIGNPFHRVNHVGGKRYIIEPGVYGEYLPVDERLITEMRQLGSFGAPIDLSSKVGELQEQLLLREIDRMKNVAWKAASGTFSVADPVTGQIFDSGVFPVQTQSATAAYIAANVATITPLKDFRDLALKGRGKGVSFGSGARAYANQTTINVLLSCTNTNDLGGKLVVNGNNILDLENVNRVLLSNSLPQIVPYEGGYIDEAGTFQLHIPDGRFLIFGSRMDGSRLGRIIQTRNAQNPNAAPGPYDEVVEEKGPPRLIKVCRGNNFGPAIEYPGSVVVLE